MHARTNPPSHTHTPYKLFDYSLSDVNRVLSLLSVSTLVLYRCTIQNILYMLSTALIFTFSINQCFSLGVQMSVHQTEHFLKTRLDLIACVEQFAGCVFLSPRFSNNFQRTARKFLTTKSCLSINSDCLDCDINRNQAKPVSRSFCLLCAVIYQQTRSYVHWSDYYKS